MEKQINHNDLLKNLMSLVNETEAFTCKDFNLHDKVYRIFNYRLASWTEFQRPDAINARGIMFDVTDESNAKVVSMPPAKFFNYEEGNVDHKQFKVGDQMVKMDGSLISTYLHNGELFLKSKASLFSSQALSAMNFLNKEENEGLKNDLFKLVNMGYTANMEYTSPDNRIVIKYDEEALTLLSARNHTTGDNLFASRLEKFLEENNMPNLKKVLVGYTSFRNKEVNQDKYVTDVRAEQEGEGYVVEMFNDNVSYLVKLKNIKYVTLHQTKEAIFSDKKLFESVIEEATDDLRSLFADDVSIIERIEEMENKVRPIYNHLVETVEQFVNKNKHLERKDFAILGQKEVPKFFGLCMASYLGKDPSFKEFAKKFRKEIFNIEDKVFDPEELKNSPIFTKKPS